MAIKKILWDDGSGDFITIDYAGTPGVSTCTFSSVLNTHAARQKVLTFSTTTNPQVTVKFTLSQEEKSGIVITMEDTVVTFENISLFY